MQPDGLSGDDWSIFDDWFEHFEGNVPQIESMVNLTTLHDVFVAADADDHDEEICQHWPVASRRAGKDC